MRWTSKVAWFFFHTMLSACRTFSMLSLPASLPPGEAFRATYGHCSLVVHCEYSMPMVHRTVPTSAITKYIHIGGPALELFSSRTFMPMIAYTRVSAGQWREREREMLSTAMVEAGRNSVASTLSLFIDRPCSNVAFVSSRVSSATSTERLACSVPS